MSQASSRPSGSFFGNAASAATTSKPDVNAATQKPAAGVFDPFTFANISGRPSPFGAAKCSSQSGETAFTSDSSHTRSRDVFSAPDAAQSSRTPGATASEPSIFSNRPFGSVLQDFKAGTPTRPIKSPQTEATAVQKDVKASKYQPPRFLSGAMLLANLFTSPIITIRFSCNNREYHLHREVLRSKSMYFQSMLDSGLRESGTSEVTFDWSKPFELAFRLVIHFLYTKNYDTGNIGCHDTIFALRQCEGTLCHLHVYMIADRLMMPELKQVAMAKFLAVRGASVVNPICAGEIPWAVDILYCNAIDREDEDDERDKASDAKANTDAEALREGVFSTSTANTVPLSTKSDTCVNPANDTDADVTNEDEDNWTNEDEDDWTDEDEDDGPLRDIQKAFTRLFLDHAIPSWRKDRKIQQVILDVPQFALDVFTLSGKDSA